MQELLQGHDRPKAHMIRVIEGFETVMFRSKFDTWTLTETNAVAVSEDGRGKVAGIEFLSFCLDVIHSSCILYGFQG